MERYSIQEARDHLSQLITEARLGKIILILGEDDQAVRLVPVAVSPTPRKAGSARGLIRISPDFDDPHGETSPAPL